MSDQLFGRTASLVVKQATGPNASIVNPDGTVVSAPPNFDSALDLSQMHFTFQVSNQDEEGPDNAAIRVYNLKPSTVQQLLKFNVSKVILQAGYGAQFGIIFQGDIKQFRVGRQNQTDTYIDILAADGDFGYNKSTIAATLSAVQNTRAGQLRAINDAMKNNGVTIDPKQFQETPAGGIVEGFRGKVMLGMARAQLRSLTQSEGSTWSIQNGVVKIIDLDGYLPGEAVVLNQATGLIGTPEQTQDGIKCRSLLNPKIQIGGLVQINNDLINQTLNAQKLVVPGLQLSYNQWAGVQNFANVTHDGVYRVYVCEHSGDTRGQEWYSDLICLRFDSTSKQTIGAP